MAYAEYGVDFLDNNYGIFDPTEFEAPEKLMADVQLNEIQHSHVRTGAYLGVLASLSRTPDGIVIVEWATGYGHHNDVVKQLTNDPNTGLSTIPLEFPMTEGVLEIGGASYFRTKSGNASIFLGGSYLVQNPETKTAEITSPSREAKMLLRDITLATAQTAMQFNPDRPFYLETNFEFRSPGRAFVQSGTLTIDDRI